MSSSYCSLSITLVKTSRLQYLGERRFVVYGSALSNCPSYVGSKLGQFSFNHHDIEQMGGRELGRIAKRASREVVTTPDIWKRIAKRSVQIAPELSFFEASLLLQSTQDHPALLETENKKRQQIESVEKNEGNCDRDEANLSNNRRFDESRSTVNKYHLISFIRAAGALKFSDSRLLTTLVPEVFKSIQLLTPEDLAALAQSFANLNLRNKDLFCLVAHTLPPYVSNFSPYLLTMLLAAFTRVGMFHEELVNSIMKSAMNSSMEFSAPLAIEFLSSLARTYKKLPPDAKQSHDHFDVIQSLVSSSIQRSLHEFNLHDTLHVFASLIVLRYYEPKFINHSLIPALAKKFEIHRNTPTQTNAKQRIEFLSNNLKTYSRLSEALMRLPPPISLGVQRFKLDVANESGEILIQSSKEMTPTQIDKAVVIRQLRTMFYNNLLYCQGAQILLLYFEKLLDDTKIALKDSLDNNEKMILRSAVENVLNDAKTKKKKYGFPITLNNEQEYNDDIDDLEKKNEIIKSDSYTESLERILKSLGKKESLNFQRKKLSSWGTGIHNSSRIYEQQEDQRPFHYLQVEKE